MWLLPAQYFMDVSDAATVLFDKCVVPEVWSPMTSMWDGNEACAWSILRLLAGVHDVGKTSVVLSSQAPSPTSFFSDSGMDVLHWKDPPG